MEWPGGCCRPRRCRAGPRRPVDRRSGRGARVAHRGLRAVGAGAPRRRLRLPRRRPRLRGPARVVGPRPRRLLVRARRPPRCDLPRPADRDAGPPRDARHRVVPGRDAQLRRARADPRAGPGRRRHRGGRGRGGRGRARGHPRRAARPRRPGPRGPGRGRCRAGRPGRRAGAQLRRDPRRLPRDGLAGRGVVVVLTGLRAAGRARPVRPDRADRARRRRRLPLQRQAVRRAGDRRGPAEGAADAAGHGAGAAPRRRGDARRHGPVGGRSPPPRRRWSSRPSRSTTRCGCSTPRARPGCPRASCRRTAGSSSSTSRRSRSSTTSAPATGSSGSPPPAG